MEHSWNRGTHELLSETRTTGNIKKRETMPGDKVVDPADSSVTLGRR